MHLDKTKNRKLKYCTNCESSLPEGENFCPACGQKNLNRKVHFWVFVGDFIREELNLDNRLFRSYKNLVFKPGFLTLEFMEGKRRSYLRPSQLFLIAGFLCFFMLSFQVEEQVDKMEKGQFKFMDTDLFDPAPGEDGRQNVFREYIRDNIQEANDNPKNFISNTLQKLPLVLLVVLPIFTLFQKLVYIRHKIYFVEHLVFSLHTHAFLFLLIFIGSILMLFYSPGVLLYIPLGMLLYLFIAFRRVYQQGFWKTSIKFSILFWLYITLVPLLWIFFGTLVGIII